MKNTRYAKCWSKLDILKMDLHTIGEHLIRRANTAKTVILEARNSPVEYSSWE